MHENIIRLRLVAIETIYGYGRLDEERTVTSRQKILPEVMFLQEPSSRLHKALT